MTVLHTASILLAKTIGIEPISMVLETIVLPLNYVFRLPAQLERVDLKDNCMSKSIWLGLMDLNHRFTSQSRVSYH